MFKIILGTVLGAIALFLASPVAHADSVDDLLGANPSITNRDFIMVGQVITIPGQQPYTVQAGDTLTKIASTATPQPANSVPAPDGGTPVLPVAATDNMPPAPTPAPAPVAQKPLKMSVNWDAVAKCESGGNWAINTSNGYEGGVQFLNSTWRSVKAPDDPPHAYQASREQQIAAAERLLARSGIGQWPVCGKRG